MDVQVRRGYNPDVLGPCTTKIGLLQNSFSHILAKIEKKRQAIVLESKFHIRGPT